MSTHDGEAPTVLEMNLIDRVCVGDILGRTADVHPRQIALVDGERRLNYADLAAQAERLGQALLALGLKRQDVVAVMARNCIELVVTYFACARAGLICAPVNLGLLPSEIAYCLRDAKTRVLIAEAALRDVEAAVSTEALPDMRHRFWIGGGSDSRDGFDALVASGATSPLEVPIHDREAVQLLYTSGTTARPKGVLTSHLAVTVTALTNALAHKGEPGFTALVCLPLFHCAMLNSVAVPLLLTGGTVVLTQGFEPHRAAALFDAESIHMVVLLPMMYGLLLADPALKDRRFSSMRRALYAMAPMPEERLKAIHAMFPSADVVLGSGQTEFTPATCLQRPEHQWSKAATWGTATAMTRVAVMDESGALLPRGRIGELVYRGPGVMNGYLNQPEETAKSFRHGWFHSGDVAYIDGDAAIWFLDRYKDVIKTGGENVASIEVERVLLEFSGVVEAAVVGTPHEHWGEAVVAAVVKRAGAGFGEAELLAHCRRRLAGFKVPKAIVFVGEFPRTGTGKIQKHLIRSQLKDLYSA